MSKSSNGTCGRSSNLDGSRPVSGSGCTVPIELRVHAEAAEDHEQAVLVARFRFADVDRADQRPVERRRAERDRADLRLSGHSPGPSLPKFAWASVHIVCPSAASGLIVNPSGRVTITALASRRRGGEPERLWHVEPQVEPGRASRFGRSSGSRRGTGRMSRARIRSSAGTTLRVGRVVEVLIGLHVEFGHERLTAAGRRVCRSAASR